MLKRESLSNNAISDVFVDGWLSINIGISLIAYIWFSACPLTYLNQAENEIVHIPTDSKPI